MTRLSVEQLIEHGVIQSNGMKKFAEEAKAAPVKVDKVEEKAKQLQNLKALQEDLKGQAQRATQEMSALAIELEADLTRNVTYFCAIWGKQDKRLIEVAGHPLNPHHHHRDTTAKS